MNFVYYIKGLLRSSLLWDVPKWSPNKLHEFCLLCFGECYSINLLKLSNLFKSLVKPCLFISLSNVPYPLLGFLNLDDKLELLYVFPNILLYYNKTLVVAVDKEGKLCSEREVIAFTLFKKKLLPSLRLLFLFSKFFASSVESVNFKVLKGREVVSPGEAAFLRLLFLETLFWEFIFDSQKLFRLLRYSSSRFFFSLLLSLRPDISLGPFVLFD